MGTFTPNYNLSKPTEASDLVDVDVLNANMDTIDTQLKNRENETTALDLRLDAEEARPYAKIGRSAAQNITDATPTFLTLNVLGEESVSTFGDTANSQLVVPLTGVYLISFHVNWAGSSGGRRDVDVQTNGSIVNEMGDSLQLWRELPIGASFGNNMHGSFHRRMTAGQTIKLNVTQTSGGTIAVNGAELSAMFVRT